MPDCVDRGARPVRGADLADHLLRLPRAADRPALCPRPALDRQEGRAVPDPRPASATRRFSDPRPSSSSSTTCAIKSGMNGAHLRRSTARKARTSRTRNSPTAIPATARRSRAAISRCRRSTATSDLRAEMLSIMADMGLKVEKHHHEVAPSQHELGYQFQHARRHRRPDADLQIRRAQRRRSSTARPRPSCRSRSRATTARACTSHQSIWKDGKPLFAGSGYADLSETALYYIGGIIKHAKAINAFTNPTTNSYKRLIPGFEAPVLLAYSARNRSASCRIPIVSSPKGKRVEVRFPDPAATPISALRRC